MTLQVMGMYMLSYFWRRGETEKCKEANTVFLGAYQACKEQYCIGTWNVRSMNQSKLEVVKQEMF